MNANDLFEAWGDFCTWPTKRVIEPWIDRPMPTPYKQRPAKKLSRAERRRLGICFRCPRPAALKANGQRGAHCQEHRDYARRWQADAKRREREKEGRWRDS